jgi:putative ABC transport system permease protein
VLRYVWRDLVRNKRRTLVSLAGVLLGVGLFSGVLFFNDGSAASLTRRAIAPLALDMQRVLTSPLGRQLVFEERISTPTTSTAGNDIQINLSVVNRGAVPANEVVINDEPPAPFSYLHGTTTLNGDPLADVVGQSPLAQGLARTGLNLGTLEPGVSITITYIARAEHAVDDVTALQLRGTISTRESVVPQPANAAAATPVDQLAGAIGAVPGVAAADVLYFVDLPPGSLHSGDTTIDRPVRLFAFSATYPTHHPSVRLVTGLFVDGSAVLSAEAARALAVVPGETVTLSLPGDAGADTIAVTGVADLARATPLFSSRNSGKFEDFLYVPSSIIISPAMFERIVIPAFQALSTTQGTLTKTLPVLEVDVMVERSLLRSDPGRALAQTTTIARSIEAIAPGQDYLIDNISNVLSVARVDAATGRRMFVFVGLPGAVIAAFLAAYAGRILASTQRRETANLRLRGARPAHLRRIIVYRTMIFAGAGAIVGTSLGFAGVLALLGPRSLLAAPMVDLASSALAAILLGTIGTGLALYMPGRRWLRREVGAERRELADDPAPLWRRRHLDLALLAVAGIAEVVAFRAGVFDASPKSVSNGESPSLPSPLLLAPLVAWLGGTMLAVRAVLAVVSRLPIPRPPAFGSPTRGLLTRSLRRRPWAVGTGIVGVCLVTAFGINLVVFAASYDAAKRHDARFVVGGDLRITPSVLDGAGRTPADAAAFEVAGVERATPVVYALENAVLIGPHDQDRSDLAAIDPATFAATAPMSDSFFVDQPATEVLASLAADPHGVLVNADKADSLSVETGDHVKIVLARGTENQTVEEFDVIAQFVRFPGFPQGIDLVVDIGDYGRATGLNHADFFLAKAASPGDEGLRRAVAALEAVPGADDPIHIDSTATVLDKDQSSLTAFDLRGLVRLDLTYTVAMGVACVAIFVLALMLQRRREYVLLRAQGMLRWELRTLLVGEAGVVAVSGVLAGTLIGIGMAHLFVYVLRPLFVLDPPVALPIWQLALLASTPLAAAVISSLCAEAMLARVEPTAALRES